MRVPNGHPHYSSLKFVLTMYTSDGRLNKLFEVDPISKDLIIRRGLLPILIRTGAFSEESVVDCKSENYSIISRIPEVIEFGSDLLPGITLRPEQELAIKKALTSKRGLIQAATGAGKTFMICGILKYLYNILGEYPNTLIVVPTQYLMESFKKSLESVGIPSELYSDCRGELSGIVVAHPKSILNDIDNNVLDFSNLKVLIGDEAHHTSCATWTKVFDSAINAEIVLGFSASIVDSRRLPILKISDLEYDEALVWSSTGDILLDIPPSYYTDGSVLAQCCVARIANIISEPVTNPKNWSQVRSIQLESEARSQTVVSTVLSLLKHNLKSLILLNTRNHGFKLLELFSKCGIESEVVCSYGGLKYYQIQNGEIVSLPSDTMEKFKTGEIKVLIGTSHIYEGVDILNLDAVVMAVVGKNSRRIIQGVGRSLRRTKNGRYAYVIDFMDHGSGILSYHSTLRRKIYHDLVGVPESRIFDAIQVSEFNNLLENIEDNKFEIEDS